MSNQSIKEQDLARICGAAAEFYTTLAKDLAPNGPGNDRVASQLRRQAAEALSISEALENHQSLRVDGDALLILTEVQ